MCSVRARLQLVPPPPRRRGWGWGAVAKQGAGELRVRRPSQTGLASQGQESLEMCQI